MSRCMQPRIHCIQSIISGIVPLISVRYSGVSIKIGKIKSLSCKVGEQKATKLWKTPLGISSPRTRSMLK